LRPLALLLLLVPAARAAVAVLLLFHAVLPAADPLQTQYSNSKRKARSVKLVQMTPGRAQFAALHLEPCT
jgi:hypothetical protein